MCKRADANTFYQSKWNSITIISIVISFEAGMSIILNSSNISSVIKTTVSALLYFSEINISNVLSITSIRCEGMMATSEFQVHSCTFIHSRRICLIQFNAALAIFTILACFRIANVLIAPCGTHDLPTPVDIVSTCHANTPDVNRISCIAVSIISSFGNTLMSNTWTVAFNRASINFVSIYRAD